MPALMDLLLMLGAGTFYLRPDADSSVGGWTNEVGGSVLYTSVDETVADDADYIRSSDNPAADVCKISLSDPGAVAAEPTNLRYRYQKRGSGQLDLVVRLKEGTTTIATYTHTDVSQAWTTTTQTLSGGEFAAITDFNNLFVEFEANKV